MTKPTPEQQTAYKTAWDVIKNAPAGKETIIRCKMANRETLIQAMLRTKSAENVARAALDMHQYGKMEVVRYLKEEGEEDVRIGFALHFNINNLI